MAQLISVQVSSSISAMIELGIFDFSAMLQLGIFSFSAMIELVIRDWRDCGIGYGCSIRCILYERKGHDSCFLLKLIFAA